MDTLKQAIRTRLITAGVNGGSAIFDTHAPIGQPPPFIIFQYVAGGYENQDALETRSELWQVKAVTDTHGQAETLAQAIHAALHQQALTLTGWQHLWTVQQDQVWMVETAARRTFYHTGGVFRIWLAKTA
ncbi:MAG: DUF3168 domain-containing protein [Anaerolineae bacterium]|nr:DUF3168 domain-containing protein [Anaerolineae bacterium]